MNISERIELLRKQRGISLTHLNNEIGAYRGKLTEVRKGKASLTDIEISTIAKELSTSTDYLLGNTDDPAPVGQQKQPPAQGGEPIPKYSMLTPENRAMIDSLIEKLLESQSSG